MVLVMEKYKITDLGLIPEDWEVRALGDVCIKIQDGNYGGSYPKSNEFLSYGVPFLTSKAIGKDGVLKRDLIDFISEEKHFELSKAHLQLNDVLFTNRGASVGAIGFVDKSICDGNIGPQLTLLRTDNEIVISRFLFHLMKSEIVQKQISSQDSGSAMNFFGIGATKKFLFPLPITKDEQTAIATALSDADNYITHLEKLIAKKRLIKQGAIQQLLQPKEGWVVKKLGDLDFDISDGNYSSKYPKSSEFIEIGVPFIRANNIKGLTIRDDDMRYISSALHSELLKGHLKKDDILITTRGEIGQIAIVPDKFIDANINAQIVRINTKNKLNKYYFAYYLLKFETQESFVNIQTGSALKQLPVGKLRELLITFPLPAEQTHIATILSDMDTEIVTLEKQLTKAQSIKQGMMQQLLTGRIRII